MTVQFSKTDFLPPLWLRNAHLQTILPRYIAKNTPDYHRTLLKDSLAQSDVAFDYVMADDQKGADGRYTTPIVVLFHGMEGSSQSHYARTLASHISTKGWHFVVAHFRSCGGVAVSGKVFYNAGDAAELAHYLQVLQQQFMPSVYRLAVMPWQNIWVSMARMPLQIVPWLSLHLWIWQVHLLPWNACLVGISTRLIYSIPLSKKR